MIVDPLPRFGLNCSVLLRVESSCCDWAPCHDHVAKLLCLRIVIGRLGWPFFVSSPILWVSWYWCTLRCEFCSLSLSL